MNDADVLKAVCCLAGADSEVSIEELQVLDGLAGRAGIEQKRFRALIENTCRDEDFRQKQIDVAKNDAAAALRQVIGMAREDDRLGEGNFTMLLWRIATNQLDVSPDQFEKLLAAET
ncbi:MAG: hypothetical protein ACYTGG_03775 [Planctomycetota bacterium]|jgi:hypothetical protein